MKYAIIAAGEGSRLAGEGVATPKPLVRVGGEELLGRLVRVFAENDAQEIAVICNERMTAVADYLQGLRCRGTDGHNISLRVMVRTTPSSMHSLHALSPWLTDGQPLVVTTVDTIFREDDFAEYVGAFRKALADGSDALMGVTRHIDDEKPLYVAVDDDGRVTGFYDDAHGCRHVSAGIYGLTAPCLRVLDDCVARGERRMRNFQRALVAEGLQVRAFDMGMVMDVDHAEDIAKAERMLRGDDRREEDCR